MKEEDKAATEKGEAVEEVAEKKKVISKEAELAKLQEELKGQVMALVHLTNSSNQAKLIEGKEKLNDLIAKVYEAQD